MIYKQNGASCIVFLQEYEG